MPPRTPRPSRIRSRPRTPRPSAPAGPGRSAGTRWRPGQPERSLTLSVRPRGRRSHGQPRRSESSVHIPPDSSSVTATNVTSPGVALSDGARGSRRPRKKAASGPLRRRAPPMNTSRRSRSPEKGAAPTTTCLRPHDVDVTVQDERTPVAVARQPQRDEVGATTEVDAGVDEPVWARIAPRRLRGAGRRGRTTRPARETICCAWRRWSRPVAAAFRRARAHCTNSTSSSAWVATQAATVCTRVPLTHLRLALAGIAAEIRSSDPRILEEGLGPSPRSGSGPDRARRRGSTSRALVARSAPPSAA